MEYHNVRHRARHFLPYLAALLGLSVYGISQFDGVVHPFLAPLSQSPKVEVPQINLENQDNETKRRIFQCGYEWPVSRIFPDYSFQAGRWNPERMSRDSTQNDILVYGMQGPCATHDIETILSEFAGKVLYINAEPNGNVFDMIPTSWILNPQLHPQVTRLFQIGPYPPRLTAVVDTTKSSNYNVLYHQQSLQVFQLALYLSREIAEQELSRNGRSKDLSTEISVWDRLTDISKKPRNTREYDAVVYLASKCHPHRQRAARQLSTILPVHHGEKCTVAGFNTSQIPSTLLTDRADLRGNYRIFQKYKYCLAMENVQQEGYMTEKLLNAYLGGCLPIYYGTREVFDVFHPKSLVFFDIDNPGPALELINSLESNQTLYEEMLSSPILRNSDKTAREFLSLFPDVAGGSLNRKIREMMGLGEIPA
jgi:Glycosyltransferase family 10 (fucosyltransferase) C-term